MAKRQYKFALPIYLSGLEAAGLTYSLQGKGVYTMLPTAMIKKFSSTHQCKGTDITQSDLDSLDDKTYNVLKKLLANRYG